MIKEEYEGYIKTEDFMRMIENYRKYWGEHSITDGYHQASINGQLEALADSMVAEMKRYTIKLPESQLKSETMEDKKMNIIEITDPKDPKSKLYINLDKTITFHPKSGMLQLSGLTGPIEIQKDEILWVKLCIDKLRRK